MTIFKLVGGTDVGPAPPKLKRRAFLKDIPAHETIKEFEERTDGDEGMRNRERARVDIKEFEGAKNAYAEAVAWQATAEAENLPAGQIEDARARAVRAFKEMEFRGHMLLVDMPTDLHGLIDLMMYMEKNFSLLPQELNGKSLALTLLKTVRLSLRHVAANGKFGPSS